MNPLTQKLRKLSPLLKSKQHTVDTMMLQLNQIRTHRVKLEQELQKAQHTYINATHQINSEREQKQSGLLLPLEKSADFARTIWAQTYTTLRETRSQEEALKISIRQAQHEVKAVSQLQERYKQDLMKERTHKEQSESDELSLQRIMWLKGNH